MLRFLSTTGFLSCPRCPLTRIKNYRYFRNVKVLLSRLQQVTRKQTKTNGALTSSRATVLVLLMIIILVCSNMPLHRTSGFSMVQPFNNRVASTKPDAFQFSTTDTVTGEPTQRSNSVFLWRRSKQQFQTFQNPLGKSPKSPHTTPCLLHRWVTSLATG